mmetsp:Transcript_14222/g.23679  ORF Transcript_14222/g.23679 Transcript_14222/m.23679 type:complete len:230 (+) Transcript_14222:367-1056(+)
MIACPYAARDLLPPPPAPSVEPTFGSMYPNVSSSAPPLFSLSDAAARVIAVSRREGRSCLTPAARASMPEPNLCAEEPTPTWFAMCIKPAPIAPPLEPSATRAPTFTPSYACIALRPSRGRRSVPASLNASSACANWAGVTLLFGWRCRSINSLSLSSALPPSTSSCCSIERSSRANERPSIKASSREKNSSRLRALMCETRSVAMFMCASINRFFSCSSGSAEMVDCN